MNRSWLAYRFPIWSGYAAAVALPFVGVGLRIFFDPILRDTAEFLPFFPVIVITAFLGGLLPGLICTGLSIALICLFIPGTASSLPKLLAVGSFATVTVLVAWLIDALKASTAASHTAQTRERLLRQEQEHRIFNVLQSIVSLARLQERTIEGEEARQALQVWRDRVQIFAEIEAELKEAEKLGSPAALMDRICKSITETAAPRRITCEIEVDRGLRLTPEQLQPLALIINELVTNALKHAFLDRSGRIEMKLRHDGPGWATLVYVDNGQPFPPDFALEKSARSGLRLVKALAEQIGGTIAISTATSKQIAVRFKMREAAA